MTSVNVIGASVFAYAERTSLARETVRPGLSPLYLIGRADDDLRDTAVHGDLPPYADGRALQTLRRVIESVSIGSPDHGREHLIGISLGNVQEGRLILDEFRKLSGHHETAYGGVFAQVVDRFVGTVLFLDRVRGANTTSNGQCDREELR